MSFNNDVGIGAGEQEVWGFSFKNSDDLFLESWSAAVFDMPGIWRAEIFISKWAEKNQRQRKRCITIISFKDGVNNTAVVTVEFDFTAR